MLLHFTLLIFFVIFFQLSLLTCCFNILKAIIKKTKDCHKNFHYGNDNRNDFKKWTKRQIKKAKGFHSMVPIWHMTE